MNDPETVRKKGTKNAKRLSLLSVFVEEALEKKKQKSTNTSLYLFEKK